MRNNLGACTWCALVGNANKVKRGSQTTRTQKAGIKWSAKSIAQNDYNLLIKMVFWKILEKMKLGFLSES